MAKENSSPAGDRASTQTAIESGLVEDKKANAPLLAKLRDTLKNYKSPHDTCQIDSIKDRFKIDLMQPLPDFDITQAKAYAASDTVEPSKQLVAHVCEWGKSQRYTAIGQLFNFEHRAIAQLVAAGNMRLSTTQEERYVLVYERPPGIRLGELIRRKKLPVNTTFIYEHILTPVVGAIAQLSELGISHGMINIDTIYISDTAVLAPCLSEPCGLSQPYWYESIERMQALPHAKGEGSVGHDYYALAVVLLEIVHGHEHLSTISRADLEILMLRQGACNALMREKDVPEVFYDFFRGALTLSNEERWTGKQVALWLGGKRFNVLPPPVPGDAVRPYEFGEKHANTRRELAYLFSSDWEHMIASLNNNQLAHWVSVSLRNKELSDIVSRLSRTAFDLSAKNEGQTYEALMNIILLLDPQGPIRIRQLSMNIDGMDGLAVELYSKKQNPELQLIARFIELNMVNYWVELQNKVHKGEYQVSTLLNNLNMRLDRLRGCIRNTGMGFGLERMMYELNPEMPCVSPLFINANVTSLGQLLIQLDRLASQLGDDDETIDRHIASFIASKLLILHEIRLDELAGIPELATNKTIMAIYLLGSAQLKVNQLRVPGLTNWLVLRTLPLMDFIHSRTLRQKYKNALLAVAPTGYIPKLAELVVSADYAVNDEVGFKQALATFRSNRDSIRYYEAAHNIEAESQTMGYNIAKMVAYICLCGSIYFLTRGGL